MQNAILNSVAFPPEIKVGMDGSAIGHDEKELIKKAINKLSLSARAYNKILKVARTIADLDASLNIEKKHLLEAIQYRSLDRNN